MLRARHLHIKRPLISCIINLERQFHAERPSSRSSTSIVKWCGTWRSTYFNLPETHRSQISCQNLFSDVLHWPFLCAHTSLVPYSRNIPARNAIPRLRDLSTFEFSRAWTDRPFILTEPVREWPVYQGWSTEFMLEKYGDVSFRAEAVDWPLKIYVEYMNHNQDESPLYLFDRSFVEKMDVRVGRDGQYWAPSCFGEDLFSVLGEQRPDHRWLIVGPEKSGSTFHKDPNATRYDHRRNSSSMSGSLTQSPVLGTQSSVAQSTGSCSQHLDSSRHLVSLCQRIKAKSPVP